MSLDFCFSSPAGPTTRGSSSAEKGQLLAEGREEERERERKRERDGGLPRLWWV
jgi:hypothetical protein